MCNIEQQKQLGENKQSLSFPRDQKKLSAKFDFQIDESTKSVANLSEYLIPLHLKTVGVLPLTSMEAKSDIEK